MTTTGNLDRRGFLRATAMTAVAGSLPAHLRALTTAPPQLAIVGTMGANSGLQIFSILEGRWEPLGNLPSKAPVSVLLQSGPASLYVLNQIDEHEGLPRGTVEAYRLDRTNCTLEFLRRQPLSLSATSPTHMALSPDGCSLVVAVAGGGAYNLLPILADGQLGRVTSTRKETGSGPRASHQDSAHPHSVVFTPKSTLIASDLGCDRLSLFNVEDGFEVVSQIQMPAGSGPRQILLHPDADLLFVQHALDNAISVLQWKDPHLVPVATVRGDCGNALAIHPSGNHLYSASSDALTTWRIDRMSGRLIAHDTKSIPSIRALACTPNGSSLIALAPSGVIQIPIRTDGGELGAPQPVASLQHASSIVFA